MSVSDSIPFGYCQCGCGQRTLLAKASHRTRGHVKGQPLRFVHGHNATKSSPEFLVEERGCETPCWIWQRAKHESDGHGRMHVGGRLALAHRVYYEREYGPIAAGMQLHHKCEQPECVNPAHLEPLTPAEHRHAHSKLTWDDVREMRAARAQGVKLKVLAERYGVSVPTVSEITNHRAWKEPEAA